MLSFQLLRCCYAVVNGPCVGLRPLLFLWNPWCHQGDERWLLRLQRQYLWLEFFPGFSGANLRPFSRMERSVEDSGFFETLTTQFSLLIVGGWFASVSLLRLLNLLLCLFFSGAD